jgi:hypothetical protein
MAPASILLFIFGASLLSIGLWVFHRKRLIENTPTSKIRSAAMGLVEIYGEAKAIAGNVLKSPFSQTDCVYSRYTIEEYRQHGKHSSWVTVKSGESRPEFMLKDETGEAKINPFKAEINIPVDNEFKSGFGKDPDKRVQEFLARNNIRFEGFLGFNKKMRYKEYYIAPGNKVFVLGHAKPAENGSGISISKAKGQPFFICDKSEKDLLKTLAWQSGLLIGFGLILTIIGVVLIR